MDSEKLRAMAERCRELLRVAKDDQIREQFWEWARDLEDEADAAENHRHGMRGLTLNRSRPAFDRGIAFD